MCGCATKRRRCGADRETDNFVAPDDLSSFEKRHLREAFAIVRSAQSSLSHRYPSTYIS
jgi:CBS domain-containing protein